MVQHCMLYVIIWYGMLLHGIVIQSDIRITRVSQLTLSNGFSRDEELWEDCVEIPWDWDWIWSLVSRYPRIVMLDFDGTCDCYVIFWWDTTWKTCTADFSEAASEIQHFHTLRCFSQFGRSSTSCSHPTTPIRAELDDLMMKVQVHYISPFTSLSTLTLPQPQPQPQLSTYLCQSDRVPLYNIPLGFPFVRRPLPEKCPIEEQVLHLNLK